MSKEQEQQASLALEDSELQKSAIRTEADVKVREIQLELEAARTVSYLLKGNLQFFKNALTFQNSSQLINLSV